MPTISKDCRVLPAFIPKDLNEAQLQHLAAIVEYSNEVILSQTPDGVVVSWNRAAHTVYGYTSGEMLGRSILTLSPPQRAKDVIETLTKIREGLSVDRFQTVWQCKNGVPINVALTFSPIKNADNVVVGVSTIARDITLENNLKSELNREKFMIHNAFNALRDIFFVVDLEGRLLRWNDHMRSASGYSDAELGRMHALDFFSGTARRDVERAIAEVLSTGSAQVTADGLDKDGRIISFELFGSILEDADGNAFAICGIARDVSERLRNEETLRLTQFAIDHCSDATYWMEPDGRIFYINHEACRSLGYTREELLGRSVYDIDPNFLPETWTEHWRLLKEVRSLRLESVHRTQSGRNIPVDISAQYVCFGNREYNCVFARDLTEKKRAQQKTREYELRMHTSQRMEALGSLASGIAHDFNNILSSILGFSQLALDHIPEKSELHDNVREIFTAGLRARDLVRQILTFSRQAEHEKQPVQIKLIVKEVLRLLRASIPATIDIQADLQSDALVKADASQMHQVLMNLCTNAGQAMLPDSGLLQVGLKTVELTEDDTAAHPGCMPGAHIELTVSDTGNGIDPSIMECIFNPFFTTKKQGEGTGLGLSVVHGIVVNHGGFVRVRSKMAEGTTFSVFLPALKKSLPRPLETDKRLPMGKEHILLVENELAVGKTTLMMLKKCNYSVTYLNSSIEALAFFNDTPEAFDLVITAEGMPYLPGHKLAAEILKIRPDIPVVLCTGHNDHISEAQARAMDIQALLMKPVEKSVLASKVREVLDRRAN